MLQGVLFWKENTWTLKKSYKVFEKSCFIDDKKQYLIYPKATSNSGYFNELLNTLTL